MSENFGYINYNCDKKSYGLTICINILGKYIVLDLITFALIIDIGPEKDLGSNLLLK